MQTVILAAGESSRFWPLNNSHKSLFKVMGRPLIWYNLRGLERAGMKDIIIVQSPEKGIEKEIKNYRFPKLRIRYLVQPKPIGTGNALFLARRLLKGYFLALNGDVVSSQELVSETIKKFNKCKKPVILGQKTSRPEIFGMMKLKGDKVLGIKEKPKKGKSPSNVKVVGIYLLEPGFFHFYQLARKSVYDFEEALSLYMKKNEVRMAILRKPEEETPAFLKYPWHLFQIRRYIFDNFLRKGIDPSASVSKKALIQGKVYVGPGTRVLENAVIKGPCYIGRDCLVGNNALIREYSDLEDETIIGANCEVARSIFQQGATTHSGYFGDSIIDQGTKIGAGTITSNLRLDRKKIFSMVKGRKTETGLNSFGAVIGKNSYLGTMVNIMPGKFIGSGCLIFPNSVVSKNIKDNSLFEK